MKKGKYFLQEATVLLTFFSLTQTSEHCRVLEAFSFSRFSLQKTISPSLTEKIILHHQSLINYLAMTD